MSSTTITFEPSRRALGPNRYLRQVDFGLMVLAAAFIHASVVLVFSLLPEEKVRSIPVRALSFKIGGVMQAGFRVAPSPAPPAAAQPAAAPAASAAPNFHASHETKPTSPQKKRPVPKGARRVDVQRVISTYQPEPQKTTVPASTALISPVQAAPSPAPQTAPRVVYPAPNGPTEYIREPLPSGVNGQAQDLANLPQEEMIKRYEQLISQWIARHRIYPDSARQAGQNGRATVRLRIDRQGNVKFFSIEQTTGYPILDQAAMEMVRRANPMPYPPDNYPGGHLLEFLVPVSFELR